MPFDRPTLQTLRDRFKQDFLSNTTTGDAVLRRSVENVFAFVVPAMTHGLYGYINYLQKQVIPSIDADIDTILRWSSAFLTVPQKAAVAGSGNVTFTGVDTTPIPQYTTVSSRDGVTYQTDSALAISGTTVTGSVTALNPGLGGNAEEGTAVFLTTPITDIEDEAVVATGGLSGGADAETKSSVFNRLVARWKTPPRGGSAGDFESWALEIGAVSRAYEYNQDPTVGWVKVVIIDDTSGPVPGAQTIIDAQANIDLKRPGMIGGCTVIGPTPQTLELYWASLVPAPGDSVAQAKTALEANVDSWILTQTVPGDTVSQPEIENAAQAVVTSVRLSSPVADPDPGTYGLFTTINHNYV